MPARLTRPPANRAPSGDGSLVPTAPPLPAAAPAPPPIPTARPASRRFRLARAYAVAARVALSYGWFGLMRRFWGEGWAERRRPALHARNGQRVRRAMLRLRGLFIKAGQLASALTNFLPEPFRRELEGLQDRVPAGPYEHVRRRIVEELGAEPEALFAHFGLAPIASASLAQVHRATLPDGRAVAVKVQHADIEAIARLDLRAIGTILRVAGRWFGVRGLDEQFAEIEALILAELDFEQEAKNTEALGARLREAPRVDAPHVVPERSSRRVLTTTFERGVKADDLAALADLGLDRTALAERIMRAYGQLIFRDGLYHADPHPGNLLVRDAGTVVFLDFGAVARLTPEMQAGLAEFLMGTMERDAARVTASLAAMGFTPTAPGSAAQAAVEELVHGVHERVLHGLDPMRFRLADITPEHTLATHAETFRDMDALGVSFRDLAGAFRVPRDWILLERTALLLLGLCTALAPDLNPFRVLWPYVAPLARGSVPSVLRGLLARTFDGSAARSLLGLPAPTPDAATDATAALVAVRREEAAARTAALAAARRQVVYTLGTLGAGALATVAYVGGSVGLAALWGLGGAVPALALVRSLRRSARG